MNQSWKTIKTKLEGIFNTTDKNDYLTGLVENLQKVKETGQLVPFEIKSAKPKGFIIKTGGLFGFVSFNYMPWKYHGTKQWQLISKYLVGKRFFGQIYSISENKKPISIVVNATNHQFPTKELIEFEEYKGVILQKSKYGIFVDIGFHLDWKFGSFVGLIHKSNFENEEELKSKKAGESINTYFHGYTKDKKVILGNFDLQREWLTGELEDWIGTKRTATVRTDENGKKEFFIDNKYKTTIPITKILYQNEKLKAKKIIEESNSQDTFQCKIFHISKKNHFVSKLITKP